MPVVSARAGQWFGPGGILSFQGRSLALAAMLGWLTASLSGQTNQALVAWGEQVVPVGFDSERVTQVAAGRFHSAALRADGTVIAWGRNHHGQCNVPTGLSNVVALAAGGWHTVAVRSDGTIALWGSTNYGISSLPGGLTNIKQVAAGTFYTLALRTNGSVTGWGLNDGGQVTIPGGLSEVIQIAAGGRHALALKSDGTVVAWGTNTSGQCNVPASVNGSIGIAAGDTHSVALKADGTVVAWGDNSAGQCSVPGGLNNVIQIAAGANHTAALRSDGTLVRWGDGSVGQTNALTGAQDFIVIAAAGWHGLGLRGDGSLGSWGWNGFAQAMTPDRTTGLVQVSAGEFHNAAARQDGSVLAWGNNMRGQLNGTFSNAAAITVGQWHSAVQRTSGAVSVFGAGDDGQTNTPAAATSVVSLASGDAHIVAARADGSVIAWGRNVAGACNVPPALSGATQVAAGAGHSLALGGGVVTAWGDGSQGITNVPGTVAGATAIASGRFHALALRSDGTVVAWGRTNEGQCSVPPGLADVVAVGAGAVHSLALLSNGTVTAWGGNDLGQGSVPPLLTDAIQVAAARYHSLALHPATTRPAVPLAITVNPQSRTVAAGNDVTLGVAAEGTGPFTYQWFRNGVELTGETNSTLALTFLLPQDSGSQFTVQVTGPGGSVMSGAGELQVIGVRPATITSHPTSQTVGAGSNVTFAVSANSNGPLFYQWLRDGTNLPGATSNTLFLPEVTLAENGATFRAIAYTAGGAATSLVAVLSVGITVPQPISAIAISSRSVALAWPDASAYEASFEVSRRPVPGGPYLPVFTTSANQVTGVDTNAYLPGIARRGYRVRALGANGVTSGYSGETIAVQQTTAAPGLAGTLARGAARYSALAGDSNWAYFATLPPAGAIWRVPRTGGVLNAVVQGITNPVTAMTAFDSRLFWREGTGAMGYLLTTPVSGTGAVTTLLVSSNLTAPSGVSYLAAERRGLFWSEINTPAPGGYSSRLRALFVTNVTDTNELAVTPPATVAPAFIAPGPIFADSNHVYWCDRPPAGPSASLWRADVTTGSSTQQLATFNSWLCNAAQNADSVFISILSQGTYRLAKSGGAPVLIRATNQPSGSLVAAGDRFLFLYEGSQSGLVRSDLLGSNTVRLVSLPTGPSHLLADSHGALWITNSAASNSLAGSVGYWQNQAPLTFTSPLTLDVLAGSNLTQSVTTAPNALFVDALNLPAWLSLDSGSRTLSGTPPEPGTNVVTLTASNYVDTITTNLVIVAAASPPVLEAPESWTAYVTAPFAKSVTVSPSYAVLSVTGLPAWAAFDSLTGAVSGTPDTAGTNLLTFSAATSFGATNQTLTLITYLTAPNDAFEYSETYPVEQLSRETSLITTHREPGEPLHAGVTNQGGSIWFTWTAPGDGRVAVSTAGSACRTLLALYTGEALTNLTEVAISLDDQPDGTSLLAAPVTGGTVYRIAIALAAEPAASVSLAVQYFPDGTTGFVTADSSPPGLATFTFDPEGSPPGEFPLGTLLNVTAAPIGGHTVTNVTDDIGTPVNPHRVLVNGNRALVFHLDNGPVPGNDAFSNSVTFLATNLLLSGTNYAATTEPGEPAVPGGIGRTLWWTGLAPGDGRVLLTSPPGAVAARIRVFSGTQVDALTPVATTSATLAGGTTAVSFVVASNGAYHVVLDGSAPGFVQADWQWFPDAATAGLVLAPEPPEGGTIVTPPLANALDSLPLGTLVQLTAQPAPHYEAVQWTTGETTTNIAIVVTAPATATVLFVTGPIPSNDDWQNAEELVGVSGADACFSRFAAAQEDEPNPFPSPPLLSVWWRWTAPWSGPAEVSTAGSDFNTRLAVFAGPTLTNATLSGANDDDGSGPTSLVQFNAVAGTTYWFGVDTADGSRGTVQLAYSLQPDPPIIDQWFAREVPGAGDGEDPDQDGVPNLLEFAFGSNPHAYSAPPAPFVTYDGAGRSYVTFSYTLDLRHPGASVIVEVSPDLIQWSSDPNETIILEDNTAGSLRTITVRDALPTDFGNTRFLRLRAGR